MIAEGEHPSREQLEAFQDGRLEGTEAEAVESHLVPGCGVCDKLLAQLEETAPMDPLRLALSEAASRELNLPGALVDATLGEAGRYHLTKYLSAGSFGEVYRALDTRLEREVAVKVSLPGRSRSGGLFLKEARNLAQLEHPGVLKVYDFGQFGEPPDERCYLVCQLAEGSDLKAELNSRRERGERMPVDAAVRLTLHIAEALQHAHTRGLVHRDIKPANILIGAEGRPLLADFGLGLSREDYGQGVYGAAGTVAYMSPEQAMHAGVVDGRSDCFSLGVILYELLTSLRPFRGAPDKVLEQLKTETIEAAPLRELEPGLPQRLERICMKALAKRPGERYQVAQDFADDLRRFLDNAPATRPARFRFHFVGPGTFAGEEPRGGNCLYLDVGNALGPGVIDHHHLAAFGKSTASGVLMHPQFLEVADEGSDEPLTIITHREPDLDAVASVYLATRYLTTGEFPPGAQALAHYADRVDLGFPGMSQQQPFTLYAALMQILHKLTNRAWNDPQDCWRRCLEEGIKVVAFVMERAAAEGKSIIEVDALACPELFDDHDRRWIESDLARYREKLSRAETNARRVSLCLPGQLGGTVEADALLVRNVQNHDDPDRCMFFKDWARTDAEAPGGRGFFALSVFEPEASRSPRRAILSVTPDSNISLHGLGALIDEAEGRRRQERFGVDDRLIDRDTGAPKPPRPGYANADPWYDGRAHASTIVDAPRSGTLLSADEIESIFIQFGQRDSSETQPLELGRDASLSRLNLLSSPGPVDGEAAEPPHPDVFISYASTWFEPVHQHVYQPLANRLGADHIFFDKHSIHSGVNWLRTLAAAIANCRVFLALYSKRYFGEGPDASAFCEWELQMALLRDPDGSKGIVKPFALEPVELPNYCRLIQAERVDELSQFGERLLEAVWDQ